MTRFFRHFRRIGIARFREPECVPAFVIVLEELAQLVPQTAETRARLTDSHFQVALRDARVGIALVAGRGGVADGFGRGDAIRRGRFDFFHLMTGLRGDLNRLDALIQHAEPITAEAGAPGR
jgi:hypothetical protein